MKIDDSSNNISRIQNIETSGNNHIESEAKNTDSGSEKSVPLGERVELSSASIDFHRAAEYMDNVSEDRIQRIEELKMQVNNGTYNIESEKIAQGILKDILGAI